jgi:two-component system NtrC family sensor kinase
VIATAGLESILPAVFEALTRADIGLLVLKERDGTLEKAYMNEAGARITGHTPDEWLAVPMWELIAPDQLQRVRQLYQRLLDGYTIPPVAEIMLRHRDGHQVSAEVAIGRSDAPDGRALVMVVRESGLQSRAQLSLLEADRVALVGALAAGFAHETNNPLTSVLLNLRSLRKQLLTNLNDSAQAAALRCLDDIATGAERIASNVRALQTLATRSATRPIDLAAVVSAALRLAAPTLEPRAHVIRQIFPVRAVAGEESRIGQAVLAMLLFSSSGFASDLTEKTNRIVIAVEERDGMAIVEVSDNGRDLSSDDALRAFDPFYRSSARGAGVGLGLGVARSIATALGGDVALAPRPEGGAVITMRLPPVPA